MTPTPSWPSLTLLVNLVLLGACLSDTTGTARPGNDVAPDLSTPTDSAATGDTNHSNDIRVRPDVDPTRTPVPVITPPANDTVTPGTEIRLSGRDSYTTHAAAAAITRWHWSVEQPAGSRLPFTPGANVADVRFTPHMIGDYRFHLEVEDADGLVSAAPVTFTLRVRTSAGIRVELVWDTPSDADQTDTGFDFAGNSKGSDLDLHLRHEDAGDNWFHNTFVCNWLQSKPIWSDDAAANPTLDRDDTDGSGPETIELEAPESGRTYTVGVHYWDSWNFGPSTATVRVFVDGTLAFEATSIDLVQEDIWEVATIAWPSGDVTAITTEDGGPVVFRKTLPAN